VPERMLEKSIAGARLSRVSCMGALCVLLVGVTLPETGSGANGADLSAAWVTSSLERTSRYGAPGTARAVEIFAGRGECESFQLVLRASGTDRIASVNIGSLKSENGSSIPASAIAIYREHYVPVNKPSPDWRGANRPLGAGWYADALILLPSPATGPLEVEPGRNQPLWIDVCVPRDSAAGRYAAKLSANIGTAAFVGEISLRVWDFALPLQPSLDSAFLVWKPNPAIDEELLKNRLMPRDVPLQDEARLIRKFGLKSTNIGLWSKATNKQCSMAPAPALADVRRAADIYDPRLRRYNYTADEIDECPSQHQTMKAWARVLHQAGVSNLVTMTPTPELYDDGSGSGRSAVDIWVLLPKMYNSAEERVAEVLAKGDEVWSYNAIVQDAYSPKWLIDFAPMNFRIQPGFMNYSLRLTGILYWQVDRWTKAPWSNVETYSNEYGNYPGEGMLVYPGEPVGIAGVAPSMRLKWIRDGVEDYEYLAMLEKLGCGTEGRRAARRVAADWSAWTHDPAVLESERRRLGTYLEAVTKSGGNCAIGELSLNAGEHQLVGSPSVQP